ncbi:Diguanylate kinase [Legionella beliardensis]|uniref:diguanylate cyclase n=1 Tax=Legionella beliardensis TaxID=91822 RepID=A0A378JPF3_9GAMM|nr:GGDEF domain-containing protein [Legionella beliardensis]STX55475.1 Diguanylate kinase [Legionella beliardensis]
MNTLFIPTTMIILGVLFLLKGGHLIQRLLKHTKIYQHYWLAYLCLIGFFILGYSGCILYGIYIDPHCLNYFYATIFLLGGFYIYLSCQLMTKTIKKIESMDELTSRFEALEHRIKHDGLTGCNTRDHLFDVLNTRFQAIKRTNKTLVILFIDMDNFKLVNDCYGHDAGDLVLKNFGQLLKQRLRKGDIVARYGGDEFILLMENVSIDEACRIAKDIIELTQQLLSNEHITISCSIGISQLHAHSSSIFEVIKEADRACYAAKQKATPDSICIYDINNSP